MHGSSGELVRELDYADPECENVIYHAVLMSDQCCHLTRMSAVSTSYRAHPGRDISSIETSGRLRLQFQNSGQILATSGSVKTVVMQDAGHPVNLVDRWLPSSSKFGLASIACEVATLQIAMDLLVHHITANPSRTQLPGSDNSDSSKDLVRGQAETILSMAPSVQTRVIRRIGPFQGAWLPAT